MPLGAAGFPFIVGAAIEPKDGTDPLDRVSDAVAVGSLVAGHQFVSSAKHFATIRNA